MSKIARWGEAQEWARIAALYTGDGCRLWPFATDARGYGSIGVSGKTLKAHRYICQLALGVDGAGMDCAHSCGNPLCCTPSHLRFATRAENEADKRLHGTDNRGERHGRTTLTADDVRAIREAKGSGFSTGELARRYNVTPGSISNIMSGVSWAWLEGENA